MNAQHIFEDGIYLLNNVAVARNPLFKDENNLIRFKEKAHLHLDPLCKIVAYAFHENQWELLVRMKSRVAFVEYYKQKHKNESIPEALIPESAYIFSQEVANLQSGFVKHFNWLNKRVGSLFYRRYQKELITNNEELVSLVERLNNLKQKNPHKGEWALRKIELIKTAENRSSMCYYGEKGEALLHTIEDRLGMKKDDLEGYYNSLPPLKIESPIFAYLRQLFKILRFFEMKI